MNHPVAKFVICIVLLGVFLLFRCNTSEVNPFTDPANATIKIESTSTVHNNDTISIFSSKKIVAGMLLRDFIDSIRITIPHNRFYNGNDTVLHKKDITASSYTADFSLYNTGFCILRVQAYRTNGTVISDSLRLYVQSPLTQKSILANVGDTVLLETKPVDDLATYVWKLSNDLIIKNESSKLKYFVTTKLPDGSGELYVSDGKYSSPSVGFNILSTDPSVKVAFVTGESQVTEPGQVSIGVRLSAASGVAVTVGIGIDSTVSSAGKEDYTLSGASPITFSPGEVFKPVFVTIVDDHVEEKVETLVLTLSLISGQAELGLPVRHTITINDNDHSLAVSAYPADAGTLIRRVNGVVDTGPYSTGTRVEINAVPDSGYVFSYFTGAVNSQSNPVIVVMDSAKSQSAIFTRSNSQGAGILRELWLGITGEEVASLTTNSQYPDTPTSSNIIIPFFQTLPDEADNYGQRLRAYIYPPLTGMYIFWISSNNQSELWLSRNDSASAAVKIAGVPDSTLPGPGQWEKYPSQMSDPVSLIAGNKYFIEALHKEGKGPDHLSVAWKHPDGTDERPIPAYRLTPYVAPNAPIITKQPRTQTVNAGQQAVFTVGATGPGTLSYRWQKDNVDITGANDTSYTTPATTPNDNESAYRCMVSNSNGTVPSQVAMLTVYYKPSGDIQPQSLSVNVGQKAGFTVTGAAGNPFPTCKWLKNGAALPGENGFTFTIVSTKMADSGVYTAMLSNVVDSVQIPGAVLKVTPVGAPTISEHPQTQTVNAGQPVSFKVTANGSPAPTYQWKKENKPLSGAISDVLTIQKPSITDTGTYTVTVKNYIDSITSNPAHLRVIPLSPAKITEQPVSQTVNAGQAVSFKVTATGNPAPNYTWKKGVAVVGGTLNTYTIQSPTIADEGSYTVIAQNPVGSDTSEPWNLKVNVLFKPVITTHPRTRSVNEGDAVSFEVVANGSPAPLYKWMKNGNPLSGGTAPKFHIIAAKIADTGTYTVLVSNSEGETLSNPAHLTVISLSAPTIITPPLQLQTVTEGQTATFTVEAVGNPTPDFAWTKNGNPLQTGKTLIINPVKMADSGYYRVEVSNYLGTKSDSGFLRVNMARPVIDTQPSNKTVTEGGAATFKVVARSSGPLSYQWWKKKLSSPNDSISGATSSSYTTPATTMADSGATFRCVVTNAGGSVTSGSAALTVKMAPPVIITDPGDTTVTEGDTAAFYVIATGTSLRYQWQKNTVVISGATSAGYKFKTIFEDSGATFRCIVTNAGGSDTSSSAKLTVKMAPPVIITNPRDTTVTEGDTARFTIVATGTERRYQWQRDVVDISGATSVSYKLSTTIADSGATFRCIVTNNGGSVTSAAALLRVNRIPAPVITTQPRDTTVTEGDTARFNIVATGGISYQWQRNAGDILGATSVGYKLKTVIADSGATFRCIVTNSGGSDTSVPATLTVHRIPAPVITTDPRDTAVKEGLAATFRVAATGTGLSYQWQKDTVDILVGATSAVYTTPATTMADNVATFRCVVTNGGGSVTSALATLTVLMAPPIITGGPNPQSGGAQGESLTFSVSATGSGTLLYQWWKKKPLVTDELISGATLSSYILWPVPADDGTFFWCLVSNGGGTTTSKNALFTWGKKR